MVQCSRVALDQKKGGLIMITNDLVPDLDPEWSDMIMKVLPELYQAGDVTGDEDFAFVYGTAFFATGQELQRGATPNEIREQTSRILQFIDETERPTHDKELFAALLARAVDDAIEGRPPCLLH
jgi:hypothetical protein